MRRTIRTGPGQLALFGALLCMLASSERAASRRRLRSAAVRAAAICCVSRAFGTHSRWQAQRTGLDGSRLVRAVRRHRGRQPAATRLPHADEDVVGRRVLLCRCRHGRARPLGNVDRARLRHLSRQRFRGLRRSRRRHPRLLRARGQRARHTVGPDAAQALSRWWPGDRCVGHRRPEGRHRSARHDQPSGRSRRRLERGNRDAMADAARGRAEQQAAAAGRPLARQLLARRVADRCHGRPLRETAEARLEGSVAREQLGLEPARRHQHAHARTLGFRPVFWR